MATRRFPPEITHRMLKARARDASTRSDHEQPSYVPPVPRRSLAGEPGANRRYNHPSSNEDLSAPPAVLNARKRHRNRRRDNPASQGSVSDMNPTEEGTERTQRNADTDRPAKRARKGASSDDDPASRNQLTGSTRFKRGKNPPSAGTSEHAMIHKGTFFFNSGPASGARASSAHAGSSNSQADANGNQREQFPYLSFTGGTGGAGGSGGNRSGNGGNATGPVIKVKNWNFYF
ncbi:hypothetical protein C8R45DRAFT_489244 [Mycena sanguinolenta]|nr:hypothetical protein C8R45DRAFT_489244 [Mycena sanguinolenta]